VESVILEHAPAEVVRGLLIQLGIASNGVEYAPWPVFVENEPDQPDNCITVEDMPGVLDGRLHPTGEVQEHNGILIRVRGARDITGTDLKDGYQIARRRIDLICEALDQSVRSTQVTLDSATYIVYSANRISSVDSLGRTRANRERSIFTVEYQFTIAQQT
jgi:hypothetical protein